MSWKRTPDPRRCSDFRFPAAGKKHLQWNFNFEVFINEREVMNLDELLTNSRDVESRLEKLRGFL